MAPRLGTVAGGAKKRAEERERRCNCSCARVVRTSGERTPQPQTARTLFVLHCSSRAVLALSDLSFLVAFKACLEGYYTCLEGYYIYMLMHIQKR